MLAVLLEAPRGHSTLTPEVLAWNRAFADAARSVAEVARVDALATLEIPLFTTPGETPAVVPLLPDGAVGSAAVSRVEAVLENAPLLADAFLSADHRLLVTAVVVEPDARDVRSLTRVVEGIEAALEEHPAPEGFETKLAGLPAMRVRIVQDLEVEQRTRIPTAIVMMLLVMLIAFRRVFASVLPLVAVGVGMAWTMGAFVLLGQSLNIVSNILPTLLLAIGVANSVHVVHRYSEEHHADPSSRDAALVRTTRRMAVACLLAYVTTAIGFLSLTVTGSRVLTDVGWQTALGLVLLYVATVLVLGSMLSLFRPPATSAPDDPTRPVARGLRAIGRLVVRWPVWILCVSLLLVAGALWTARDIVVDSGTLETYDEDHPVTQTMRLVEDELGGVLAMDVDLEADDPGTFLDPVFSARVAAFTAGARTLPDVLRATSYVDVHEAVWKALGVSGPPDADRLAWTDRVLRDLGEAVPYWQLMAADRMHARISIRVKDMGTRELLTLADTLGAEVDRHLPADSGARAKITGDGLVFAAAMDAFVRQLVYSLLGAAAVIFFVIALLFRSLRLGLISVLPNLTPLMLTLGYMGFRDYPLSTSNVIVFAISLGVAVDDTIHFLARLREELHLGLEEAIRRTLLGAGRAMVLTTLLILAGLVFLFGSDFVPTRRFAELATVTMISALLGDLVLLPACLRLFGRRLGPAPNAS